MRGFTAPRLVRSSARDARVVLSGAAAVLVLVVLAATGCGDNAAPAGRSSASSPTAGAPVSPVGQRVSSLIAPRHVPFAVAFTSQVLWPFTGPEYLFWSPGKGVVRWDMVPSGSDAPATGWFTIDNDTAPAGDLPYTTMQCLWFRQSSPGADGTPQARISCSEGGRPPDVLFGAMVFDITEGLPDQTIAGRRASCYSFDYPTMSLAVFCVDASAGIPLLLSTVNMVDPRFTQDMRAVSVSTADQKLEFPIQLEKSPVDGWWEFEGQVPISALQLPDFGPFEE